MKVLTRENLDLVSLSGCGSPGCTHSTHTFYIHSRCHPESGVELAYTYGSGLLNITCRECHTPVVVIKVAKGEGQ